MNIGTIEEVRWQIYNSFPAGELAVEQLLSLFSLEFDDSIPTAAVKCGYPPRIVLNRTFVEANCRSVNHLVVLVLHEIFHVVLGHTRLFKTVTRAENFAFDAVINAMICKSLPEIEYISFFQSIYKDEGPEALLRPPQNWRPWSALCADWKLKGDLGCIHKSLYGDSGNTTYRDVYEQFLRNSSNCEGILLIGDHDSDGKSDFPDAVVKAIVEIVGKWPALDPRRGRDRGTRAILHSLLPDEAGKNLSLLIQRGIKCLAWGPTVPSNNQERDIRECILPYPTVPDRKPFVLRLLGQHAVNYRGELSQIRRVPQGRVRVYLDVSGSMKESLPLVVGALDPLRRLLHGKLHGFSTEIHDIDARELSAKGYVSTLGTDINCVLEHLITNQISKAAIFTDGYVGNPTLDLLKKIGKNVRIVKFVVPPFYKADLDVIPGRTIELDLTRRRN